MYPRWKLIALWALLVTLTAACENTSGAALFASLTPALTETPVLPSATTFPTPTLTPTPTPFPGSGLQGICYSVERTNLDNNTSGDIRNLLDDLFGQFGMGLSGLCDAALTIIVTYDASSAEYLDQDTGKYQTCYTGTSVEGEMRFEKPGSDPLVFQINKHIPPFSGTIYTCPTLQYASLDAAWGPGVVDGLYAIFGPEVLGHLIFHGLVWGSPRVQTIAADKLKSLGEKGMPAVPVILDYLQERYGDELPEFEPTSDTALAALRTITGQDFGRDVTAWVSWWNSRQ